MRRALLLMAVGLCLAVMVRGQAPLRQQEDRLARVSGTEKLNLLNRLADGYARISPEKSVQYAGDALRLARELDNTSGEARARFLLGQADFHQGHYEAARAELVRAESLYRHLNDLQGLADCLSLTGSVYERLGDYETALSNLLAALQLQESGRVELDATSRAGIINSIGIVYYRLGEEAQTLDYFQQALKINEKSRNRRGVSDSLNNIGVIYKNRLVRELAAGREKGTSVPTRSESFQKALNCYRRSLAIRRQLGDRKGMADSYNNIAVLYFEVGALERNLEYNRKALELRQAMGDKSGTAMSLNNIAENYADPRQGQYRKSLGYYSRALALVKEIGARKMEQSIYRNIADVYQRLGDYRRAYENFVESARLNSEIFTRDSQEKIAEMQTRFDTEKKEREIELLKKDQAIQEVVRNAFIGGFGLLVLLVFLLYNRYRLKTRANALIGRKNRELEVMDHIVKSINREMEMGPLLQSMLHQSRVLFPSAEKGIFLIRHPRQGDFRVAAAEGYSREEIGNISLTREEIDARYTRGTECLGDGVYIVRRFAGIAAADKLAHLSSPESVLAMAVTIADRLEGFLVLDNLTNAEAFDDSDVEKLLRFREHAVSAIVKAKSLGELEVEKERAEQALVELQDAHVKLELAARHDPLTGLSNRRDMMEKLEIEQTRFKRSRRPFTLVLADIDHFKTFNDTFGHECGDQVLSAVANLMTRMVREQDCVSRWGGEEFLLLLPETGPEGGQRVAERIRAAVAGHEFHYDGRVLSITMTLGTSCYTGVDGVQECIRAADEALYRGKHEGRNRVVGA